MSPPPPPPPLPNLLAAPARRIACLWLPRWSFERWARAERRVAHERTPLHPPAGPGEPVPREAFVPDPASIPVALTREGSRGPVIHGLSPAALALGLAPGDRVADVLSGVPHLRTVPVDSGGDRAALDRATAWARRWSPHVRGSIGARGDASLLLDTTGCDHLAGGEASMAHAMRARLAALGYTARVAIAPTPRAALTLAMHGDGDEQVVAADGLAGALAPLPIAALGIDANTTTVLRRLGLKTVGDLAAVPRASLRRRFAKTPAKSDRDATWEDLMGAAGSPHDPLRLLDLAHGRVTEPLVPVAEDEPLHVATGLLEPIDRVEAVRVVAIRLLDRLMEDCAKRGAGASALQLVGYRVDGGTARLHVRAARPTRDAGHWLRLVDERLENMDAGEGFDAFTLEALYAEPLEAQQDGLEDRGKEDRALALVRMVDALSGRLGEERVLVPITKDSHWPERAEAWVPAMGRITALTLLAAPPGGELREPPTTWAPPPGTPPRPERLIDPPEPIEVIYGLPDGPPVRFRWRRVAHRVVRHAGPERIAPEWWREPGSARGRDYWRVEDERGGRFWLFRAGLPDDGRGLPEWFCQGVYA